MKKTRSRAYRQPRLHGTIHTVLFFMVMCFASLAVLNLLPIFLEDLGGSPRQIGFLMGLFSLASLISRPVVGWVLARYSPRGVMIAGLGLQLAVTIGYLFVGKLGWLITFIRAAHGVAVSFFIVAALTIVVRIVSESQRAYALGVVSAGFMIPLLVVPYIAEEIIYRSGFTAYFLFAVFLVTVPFLFFLFKRFGITSPVKKSRGAAVGYLRLMFRRRILVISLMTVLFELGLSAMISFVPLLTVESPVLTAGLFFTCLGGTAVFMRLFVGRRLRIWGNARLIFPAFLFLAGGTLLIHLAYRDWMLMLSGIILGVGTGILYPHLSSAVVHGLEPREQGKALSIFAGAVDLGFFAGPVVFGVLSQGVGVRDAFLPFAGILLLLSLGLTVWAGSHLFQRLPMPVQRPKSE